MTNDTVRIICPNLSCRSILAVPEKARGHVVKCRMCGRRVLIPAKREPVKTVVDVIEDEDEEIVE